MPEFHQLQSYFPVSLGDQKLGLLQVMLNSLSGTPDSLEQWIGGVFWDEENEEWSQPEEAPVWDLRMKGTSVQIKPHFMTWKASSIPGLSTSWLEVSLLLKSEDIQADSLSGFNLRVLPLLEMLAIAMCKVLRPNELFFTNSSSAGSPWESLQSNDPSKIWDFDFAILSSNSGIDISTVPSDYECRTLTTNLHLIRSKWVSFDMKKGATKRS